MRLILIGCLLVLVVGCGKIPQSEYRYINTKEMK